MRLASSPRIRRAAAAVGAAALIDASASILAVSPSSADTASGGSGPFQPSIDWIEWGAEGDAIAEGVRCHEEASLRRLKLRGHQPSLDIPD